MPRARTSWNRKWGNPGEGHAVSGHVLGEEGAETHKDQVLINVVKEDGVAE